MSTRWSLPNRKAKWDRRTNKGDKDDKKTKSDRGKKTKSDRGKKTKSDRGRKNKLLELKRMTKTELQIGALVYPERTYWKPQVRGDCEQGIRPCPYLSCRHNLYLEVTRHGSILLNFPDLEPWEMPAHRSCSLDMAEAPKQLREIGDALNISRERIRQIEHSGLAKIRRWFED